MAIQIANNALENCHTLEQVVNLINDPFSSDASVEMMVAKYAADTAFDSDYTDRESISSHLDFLLDAGAIFDAEEALKLAVVEVTELKEKRQC